MRIETGPPFPSIFCAGICAATSELEEEKGPVSFPIFFTPFFPGELLKEQGQLSHSPFNRHDGHKIFMTQQISGSL